MASKHANGRPVGGAAVAVDRSAAGHELHRDDSQPTAVVNQSLNWRDVLPIHPAANLFPVMTEAELKELAEDIKKHGIIEPVTLWETSNQPDVDYLLDGRNRLDAAVLAGTKIWDGIGRLDIPYVRRYGPKIDPVALVVSLNIHRRHLTADQKRDLIGALLKANSEHSNRKIAGTVSADHKTVGTVRTELEGRGEIPHVENRVDSKGRKQPAKRAKAKPTAARRANLVVEAATIEPVTAKPSVPAARREHARAIAQQLILDHGEAVCRRIAGACNDALVRAALLEVAS